MRNTKLQKTPTHRQPTLLSAVKGAFLSFVALAFLFTAAGLFFTSNTQNASALSKAERRNNCKNAHFVWSDAGNGSCDKTKCESGWLMRGTVCKNRAELKNHCENVLFRDWRNDNCSNDCKDGYVKRDGDCKKISDLKDACEKKFLKWDSGEKKCTSTCIDGYVKKDGKCEKSTALTQQQCKDRNREWKDGKCTANCADGYVKRDGDCKKMSDLKDACDAKNRVWNQNNKTCTQNCKAGYEKKNGVCSPQQTPQQKCAQQRRVWQNGQCTQTCITGWKWNAAEKKCKQDGTNPIDKKKRDCARLHRVWNDASNQCTPACLTGYKRSADGKKCVVEKNENEAEKAACKAANKVWSVQKKKCLNQCLKGYTLQGNNCVKANPKDKQKEKCEKSGHVWENGKCTNKCRDGYKKKGTSNKCVKVTLPKPCTEGDTRPKCQKPCDPADPNCVDPCENDPSAQGCGECDPTDPTCDTGETDTTDPEVEIVRPYEGDTVGSAPFSVVVKAVDYRDDGTSGKIEKVELLQDGELLDTASEAPYVFEVDPAALEDDTEYEFTAVAYDTAELTGEDYVTVKVKHADVPKPATEKTFLGYDGNTAKISLEGDCVDGFSASSIATSTLAGIFENNEKLLLGANFSAKCSSEEEGVNVTIDLGKKYEEDSMGIFKINSEGSVVDYTDSIDIDNSGATTILQYSIVDGDELDSDSAVNSAIQDPIIITTNPDNKPVDTGDNSNYDNYDSVSSQGTDGGGTDGTATLPNTGAGGVIGGLLLIVAGTVAASMYNNKYRKPKAATVAAPTVGDTGFMQPLGTGESLTEQPQQYQQPVQQQPTVYAPTDEQAHTPPENK